jgi:hypothetical protein
MVNNDDRSLRGRRTRQSSSLCVISPALDSVSVSGTEVERSPFIFNYIPTPQKTQTDACVWDECGWQNDGFVIYDLFLSLKYI